jgi:hypothetical protein
LRRRFHGARSDLQKPRRQQQGQADILTDGKGRAVSVERHARTSPPETARQDDRGFRGKSDHHRRNHRAARPSRIPRGKR